MKKFLIGAGAVVLLLIVALFAIASIDFNRLGKDNVYVQITVDGEIEEFKDSNGRVWETYWYTLPAYDESGEQIEVTFSATKNLRKEAYLMLYVKDENYVTSYDEVQYEDLPKAVQQKLNE